MPQKIQVESRPEMFGREKKPNNRGKSGFLGIFIVSLVGFILALGIHLTPSGDVNEQVQGNLRDAAPAEESATIEEDLVEITPSTGPKVRPQ